MPNGKTRLKTLLVNLIWLSFIVCSYGQPKQWEFADLKGTHKFSVSADTAYALMENLFCIRLGSESVVVEGDLFHPVLRSRNEQFLPLTQSFFMSDNGRVARLYGRKNINQPLPHIFKSIKLWNGRILGKTDIKCVFNPTEAEEMVADSFRIEARRLLLFREDGILEVDSALRTRFFPIRSINPDLNSFSSYVRSDTLWKPVSGSGFDFVNRPGSFWWNDTLLLDSSGNNVYWQSPHTARTRIADSISVISNRFSLIRKKTSFYILTPAGKRLKVPSVKKVLNLRDSVCAVQTKSRWVLLSEAGNRYPVNKTISELGSVEEGMVMAKAGKRYGYIDLMGFIRISCRYDSLLPFQTGISAARLGSVWGFLDRDEKLKIQPHYQKAGSFYRNLASVEKEGKWGLLNRQGDFVQPCIFDSVVAGRFTGWKTVKGNWTGWLSTDGKILLANRYTDIIEPCSGFLQVLRDGKTGLFSSEGISVLPIQYSKIYTDPETQTLIAR
jgi:hypothetical protein